IIFVQQLADFFGPIDHFLALANTDLTPGTQRFTKYKIYSRAVTPVLMIISLLVARLHWQRLASMIN
ncbi:MAG: hypothetical protein DRP45_09290, partial [Candidatus Zixiibacteriota bacterium]